MKRFILLIGCLLFFLISCSTVSLMPTNDDIIAQVPSIAEKYIGMEYAWGGQDWWWEDGGSVDCSGLVINVYKEACEGSWYSLPYVDSTVLEIWNLYSIHTDSPRVGDVIFMGDSITPTHIAILVSTDSEVVEFIDAYSTTGHVEKRKYLRSNPKILSYGILLVKTN